MVLDVGRFIGLVGRTIVLAAAATAWGEPTLSLQAVAINGVPIAPTNEVAAVSGDIIKCEIYGSNWSPNMEKLGAWQVTIDGGTFATDANVMPAYWDAPAIDARCTTDEDCAPDQVCYNPNPWEPWYRLCVGPNHHPEDGAFIDSTRPDYVFGSNPSGLAGVDLPTLSFRYAATVREFSQGPVYTPPPKYFATFTLEMMPCACGTFTVGLLEGLEHTFFVDAYGEVTAPTTVGLEISTGEACRAEFVAVDPPDCTIDARQPSRPDGSNPAGWDSITLVPTCPGHVVDLCTLVPGDFGVREVPTGGPAPPLVSSVTCGADSATVTLNRLISLGKWTCVMYLPTGQEFCLAHLPGDVNGDRTAAPADILRVIDCLNGVASCEIWQCDVDSSNVCGPPDILRVIDLLNGAGVYEPWLNRQLVPCPSAW